MAEAKLLELSETSLKLNERAQNPNGRTTFQNSEINLFNVSDNFRFFSAIFASPLTKRLVVLQKYVAEIALRSVNSDTRASRV